MQERLPFCSQNANRDENAMVMSHGAAALAGERGRGETDWGQHTECQTTAPGTGTCPSPPGILRNGGLSPPGPAQHTTDAHRRGSEDRQVTSLRPSKTHCVKKNPLVRLQDCGPAPLNGPARCGKQMPG